ncbi:MAG: cation:proton antiporter [Methanosphaera sp.]|uniref:cation:proton antiporter n=1 Tax=Methanosphaera sp. TaxID=2666342 RepID=UPI0025E5D1D4|nr:cation:proton antiporter [Methanosphaera sp.]MCI5866823.1 cation:proton antiporter [Methanosphaera sp.]MDD6534330.1 cation:proton antiporter [Methanosphaera sp.]MDY3955265.1 cation:proton antiporter [Methanosphaera sp.]
MLILLASCISVKFGISVSIVEIVVGIIAGNLGILQVEPWMLYIASIGGMVLTFLAGTEIDFEIVKDNFKTCLFTAIGSFGLSFICVLILCYMMLKWDLTSSLLVAVALSETSIAIVYSVILSRSLSSKTIGTILMGSTFLINIATALALSILFMKPDINTLIFIVLSVIILCVAYKFSNKLFESRKYSMQKNELEIKYIFLLITALIFLANVGGGQALLFVFILGALLAKPFSYDNKNNMLKRLQTVAFSVITPIFFIVGGMKVSIPIIMGSIGVFLAIFIVRVVSKFIGAYPVISHNLDDNHMFISLILSTGLTFGLVAALYGLNNHIISSEIYSILTGVLVLSAILPTFIADKFYPPVIKDE